MDKITGNEQAFPVAETINPGSMTPIQKASSIGLTIRQQFAAMAMQARITAEPDRRRDYIVNDAVSDADALIAELNKEKEP